VLEEIIHRLIEDVVGLDIREGLRSIPCRVTKAFHRDSGHVHVYWGAPLSRGLERRLGSGQFWRAIEKPHCPCVTCTPVTMRMQAENSAWCV
jgi:hypothetical protein